MKKITLYIFIFYIINSLMEITVFNTVGVIADAIKIVRYLCYMFFIIKIAYDIVRERAVPLVAVAFLVLSGIVVLSTDHMRLGAAALALVAVKDIDAEQIIKHIFYALSVFFAAVVILSLLGIIPDLQHARGALTRHALGFHYPTDTHSIFLTIVLIYVYRKSTKPVISAALLAANAILFYFTNARMSFILITLVLIIAPFTKKLKIPDALIISTPIVLCALAFLLVLIYSDGSAVGIKLNGLLSDRLLHSANALDSYPVTAFGTAVEWHGYGFYETIENFKYNFVDISYIRMIFDYGVVASVVIIAAYTLLLKDLCSKKDYTAAFVVVAVLIWSFIEPYIFSIARNIFIVLFARYLERAKLPFSKSNRV